MVRTVFFTREDVAGSLTSSEPSPHPEATRTPTTSRSVSRLQVHVRHSRRFTPILLLHRKNPFQFRSVQVEVRTEIRPIDYHLGYPERRATRSGWVDGRVPGAHQFRGGFGGPSVDGRPIDEAYPADLGRPGIDDRPDTGDDGRRARCLRIRYGRTNS